MQSDNARIVTEEHNSLQASEAEAIHEQCFLPRPAKPQARLTQYTTNASQYMRLFCSSPGAELEGSHSIFSCLAFFLLSSGEERDKKKTGAWEERDSITPCHHTGLYIPSCGWIFKIQESAPILVSDIRWMRYGVGYSPGPRPGRVPGAGEDLFECVKIQLTGRFRTLCSSARQFTHWQNCQADFSPHLTLRKIVSQCQTNNTKNQDS
jgi:hypothetical protein